MKATEEPGIQSDERLSIGYFSSNGLSRSNSSQNVNAAVDDPASLLMQKRIDDLEVGFKQLDRRADDVDYDIETLEMITGKLRVGFDDVREDIQLVRDEMMNLFERLDAIQNDMNSKTKRGRSRINSNLYRSSYLGSRQALTRASQSELRGSSYSLDRTYKPPSVASIPTSTKENAVLSAKSSVDDTPEMTPTRSPLSSQTISPARSKESIHEDEYLSDNGSDY